MKQTKKNQKRFEVLLLGTGTSSQVPSIACLTDPSGHGCRCCLSTDKKNQRRNTSAIVRIHRDHHLNDPTPSPSEPSSTIHILIDVGKSFCEAARDHFPKNQIRKLDAVLLTHPHADAINGLDDLRAWTLRGVIQDSIPIYCDRYTYSEISRMYPYLVDSDAKTGGGDVPQFEWNIIENEKSFEICGIQITPLAVHHGKFFGPGCEDKPYICLSYLVERAVYYVSDVSEIPEKTIACFKSKFKSDGQDERLKILILDALNLRGHPSHFGISQATRAAEILNPHRTYLVGFSHRVSHDCWMHCCRAISDGKKSADFPREPASLHADDGGPPGRQSIEDRAKMLANGMLEDFDWFTHQALALIEAHSDHHPRSSADHPPWIRPGFDGLLAQTAEHPASIADNFYDM